MKLHQGWLKVLLGEGGDHLPLKPLQWLRRLLLTHFGFFSFFAHFLWLQGFSPRPGPFHLCVVSLLWAWKPHQAASESRELISTIPWVHELAQIHLVLCLPLTHTQHSSFPCSLIIMFWVKIWPFSSRKLNYIMQHHVPSSAGWNRAELPEVGAAPCSATALLVGSADRILLCISFSKQSLILNC